MMVRVPTCWLHHVVFVAGQANHTPPFFIVVGLDADDGRLGHAGRLGLVGEVSWVLPLAVFALLALLATAATAVDAGIGVGDGASTNGKAPAGAVAVALDALSEVQLVVQACDGVVERGGLLDDGDLALPHSELVLRVGDDTPQLEDTLQAPLGSRLLERQVGELALGRRLELT